MRRVAYAEPAIERRGEERRQDRRQNRDVVDEVQRLPRTCTSTVNVRPRAGGENGEESAVAFTVLAPWFRTAPAYAIYALSAVVVVGLIVWLPSYLQRREKLRLARLVARRPGMPSPRLTRGAGRRPRRSTG